MIKRNALFRKIFLAISLSMVLYTLVIGLFLLIEYRSNARNSIFSGLPEFYRRNSFDMGIPPSREKGEILARRLGVDIFYFGDSSSWRTLDDAETALFAEKMMTTNKIVRGYHRGKLYVGFGDERGYFFFYGNLLFNTERLPKIVGVFFIVWLLFFITALILIRLILSPVKGLEQGVRALEDGDFTFRISGAGNDELGDLAKGFNHMTEQIQRMIADKEQLMLNVSHELKTPLTRIKLSLEFLDDEVSRKSITEDLDEMEAKIREILTSARLDTPYGNPATERINLPLFLKAIVKQYGKASPGARLLSEEPAVFVDVDPGLFRTACKNILENAIRYSKPDSAPVEIRYGDMGDWTEISFRDHGIGIPQEHLERVFEPFYRVDVPHDEDAGGSGGYGLGLYLAKKIITSHTGSVSLESEVGKGTLVRVFLRKSVERD